MKYKRKFHGFLIDADNTIFDFDRAEREAFHETLSFFGINDIKTIEKLHTLYAEINNRIWKSLERGEIEWKELNIKRFEDFLLSAGGNFLKISPDKIADKYIEILSKKSYTIPHAIETLDYLSKRADLILGTNGISKVQRNRIARAGIEVFFKGIIISEDIGVSKPSSAFFDLAVEKLDLPRNEILCVGDSITSDMIGGTKAGLTTCLFIKSLDYNTLESQTNNLEEICDYIIEDIRELKKFAPPLS